MLGSALALKAGPYPPLLSARWSDAARACASRFPEVNIDQIEFPQEWTITIVDKKLYRRTIA